MRIKIWSTSLLVMAIMFSGIISKLCAQDIETASRKGKIEEIKMCLAKGANPNYKWDKQTLLAHSLNDISHEITILLANTKGVKINEWNIMPQPEVSWKYTALHKAVKYPDIVKLLVEKGALIDLQDDWLKWDGMPHESGGNTPLMLAINRDPTDCNPESAKYLMNKGAKIDIQNRGGYTALMFAVHNAEITKMLIDKGAKLDIQTKGGETALMFAAIKYPEAVKLLLNKGANILIRQSTFKVSPNALDYAARYGNIETAKLILAKAVSLGVKDEVISGALHWAVISDQVVMAKYLLDEGAKIEGTDGLAGYTPLMETSLLEMVELLVSRGANVNAKNKFNYTPLHKAVFSFIEDKRKEKDCEKILNLLLEKGANPDNQDGNGNTPLMTSVQKITAAKMLVAKGANVNIQNFNGETALMYAVKGGLIKVVIIVPIVGGSVETTKLLLSKGADVNLQDKWGKTALMHAAGAVNAIGNKYSTYTDILELLLDKGAKLEIQDKEGHTALYWAMRYNRTKSADLLIAKGANPAQKYDKATDKSNIQAGIVGTWENSFKVLNPENTLKKEYVSFTTRVIFNADWTYSKVQIIKGQVVPDGGRYSTYELRDGRIWLFNKLGTNAVIEYRFEGKILILNGEKFVKVLK
jgi:ankyrin repeat protein